MDITGLEANLLLFAFDQYVKTDDRGKVLDRWIKVDGLTGDELQVLRDKLFAAHEHPEEGREYIECTHEWVQDVDHIDVCDICGVERGE